MDRDAFCQCPDCRIALQPYGRRLGCDRCGGTLITDTELTEMMCAIDPDHPRELTWPKAERASARQCPKCQTMMSGMRIEGVVVERCPAHGVWFDQDELAKVLAPEADAEEFAREYRERQATADRLTYGRGGVVVRDVYRSVQAWLKQRRMKQ